MEVFVCELKRIGEAVNTRLDILDISHSVKKGMYVYDIWLCISLLHFLFGNAFLLTNGTLLGIQPVNTSPLTLYSRGSSLCDFTVEMSESTSEGYFFVISKPRVLFCAVKMLVKQGQADFSANILPFMFCLTSMQYFHHTMWKQDL